MPAAQPTSSAQPLNQRVYRPKIIAGKICTIHTPPSNCRSSANCVGMKKITSSAPILTISDTILATTDSSRGVIAGWMNGFQMLRVKVLAAPIDITAAGTSAPSAIAAKQKPANQSGNTQSTSCGTASCGDGRP